MVWVLDAICGRNLRAQLAGAVCGGLTGGGQCTTGRVQVSAQSYNSTDVLFYKR